MSKKLLIDNYYIEDEIKWDYEKISENPISIKDLCKEYFNGTNINLNTFSNNQILEVNISQVLSINSDPQILLLCDNNIGGKIYWNGDNGLKMANNPNFELQLTYPVKLRVTLINNTFSLYINEVLQDSANAYLSQWLPFTGIQIIGRDLMFVTEFRYKNFERS